MQIKNLAKEEIRSYFQNIEKYLSNKDKKFIKYLDLGCKVVRLIGYSEEFLPHIEKQLTFVLRDSMPKFDATIILWKEENLSIFAETLSSKFSQKSPRARVEKLYFKQNTIDFQVIDNNFSKTKPVIDIQVNRGIFYGNDYETDTYYHCVANLEPEEYIKEGHLFVQILNNILKTPTSNLAHGAVIGLNGNGILICARGQRGKSTLSVLSMMKGFEYVSDDYLILHKNGDELLSSPIYSIITLSPKMYNELYDKMSGSQFVSNNARKDKYVFNIGNFHDRFKMNYPIKICMFPEIVTDPEPSIVPCEKGRAITQIIQSTLSQTQDLCENKTVKKMMDMIKDFEFYKFNLCHDIDKNTEFLRDFMNNLDKREHKVISESPIYIDITFDLANIINSRTGIIYSMNKFATNVFENLLEGVSASDILNKLRQFIDKNKNIERDFNLFVEALEAKGIFTGKELSGKQPSINLDFALENDYRLSFVECIEEEYKELVKEIKENENELCIK